MIQLRSYVAAGISLSVLAGLLRPAAAEELYVGSGVKAGEITATEAIIHVRLTAIPEQNTAHLIPGREGWARLSYGLEENSANANTTGWRFATADDDYSIQFRLADLQSGRRYHYQVEYRPDQESAARNADRYSFKTAPAADQRAVVKFQVTTGQDIRGAETYVAMAAQKPDFLVSTGDNVYYDGPGKAHDLPAAYRAYQMMYGLSPMKAYFRHVGGYFEKDDHDYRFNDSDRWQTVKGGDGGRRRTNRPPEQWLSHDEGIMVFKKVFPMSDPTYRTFRWGKGVQIWLTEGRDFRSPNNMPDGPDKSLWGRAQLAWLKHTLLESDADWRVLISPTPIIGPDRTTKTDNHANPNGFWTEGQAFLDWLKTNQLHNVVLMCGDRHWQYHAVDGRNGRNIHEFSCGPTCDEHTQKVPPLAEPFFRGLKCPYANSKGGYLTVTYEKGRTLSCEFHYEDGSSLYRHVFRMSNR